MGMPTYLQILEKRNQVTIIWMSGHDGVEVMKQADKLAKTGAAFNPLNMNRNLARLKACKNRTKQMNGESPTR